MHPFLSQQKAVGHAQNNLFYSRNQLKTLKEPTFVNNLMSQLTMQFVHISDANSLADQFMLMYGFNNCINM